LTTSPTRDTSIGYRGSLAFRTAVGEELLAALDGEVGPAYAVDRDLTLQFVNLAWDDFALANHGEHCIASHWIGRSVREAIPGVLLSFYDEAFASVFALNSPWEHLYECSAPTKQRFYRMRTVPLHDGDYLVVSNELVQEVDALRGEVASGAAYIDGDGFLLQCANCRRCRRVGTTRWDWVPAYVADPLALVSHGLCPTCLAVHYPA
jgi:hypothetical protein